MEWFIMNSSGVRSLATGLVEKVAEDKYIMQDECADVLEELLEKINSEDIQTSMTKRHLLTERMITKDIIPLVKFACPDTNELALVYKLLATLCETVDSDLPNNTKQDLHTLTTQIREAFNDMVFVTKLFDHVKELIEEGGELEQPYEAYEAIKYLLMLVRNILYCTQKEDSIQQTALYSLLLRNDIGPVILYSINCHAKDMLSVHVAQLLSQLYHTFEWNVKVEEGRVEEHANEYVTNKLRCLIVQLLQGSLSTLISSLQRHEMKESSRVSYIPWCLAYFLRYINHVPVPISNIRAILSSKCIGYLVYQLGMLSVSIFSHDQLESNFQQSKERLMLLFSAIEGLLTTTMDYQMLNLNKEELQITMQFYKDLVEMSDLWRILLLHIGNFDLGRFPRSFLAQLICTNHKLFTAVEFYNKTFCGQLEDTVLKHFTQFAVPAVIERYALLVESYSTNTEQTNMAVFTMLCHICVDCDKKELLYTPTLLRLLGALIDNMAASEEDRQLADFVVKSFLDDLSMRPQVCVEVFANSAQSYMDVGDFPVAEEESPDADDAEWSDSEENDLFSLVVDVGENSSTEATVELLAGQLAQLGINRTKEQITHKLQQLGIIEAPAEVESGQPPDLSELVTDMVQEGEEDFISWIQQELLTASFNKAVPKDSRCKHSPLCRYSILQGHDYPLIPYSHRLNEVLARDKRCRTLMDLLQLPYQSFNGSYLPHIPMERSAGQLYTIAERIKSIETAVGAKLPMSCDSSTVSVSEEEEAYNVKSQSGPSTGPSMRLGDEGNVWLSYYMHSGTSS